MTKKVQPNKITLTNYTIPIKIVGIKINFKYIKEERQMIKISQLHVENIIKQAKQELPNECCGILAGFFGTEGNAEIVEIYPMTNIDNSPQHFSLDPKEQFKVYRDLSDKGLKLLGNYHSHPSTPARPSKEDIRLAYDPKVFYMILSLAEEIPVLKCFRITNGQSSEVQLVIE